MNRICWKTDESASQSLCYGLPGGSFSLQNQDGFGANHCLTITGLEPQTAYRYYVASSDPFGNSTQSVEQTFITTDKLWLRTAGNKIHMSDGQVFRGRGANIHDTRGCNACTWSAPDVAEVKRRIDEITENWGANFLRLTLESYAAEEGRTHWRSLLDDEDYLQDIVEIVVYETHVYDSVNDFNERFYTPSATLPVIIGEFGPAQGYMTLADCASRWRKRLAEPGIPGLRN